jgi:hypothetical protein
MSSFIPFNYSVPYASFSLFFLDWAGHPSNQLSEGRKIKKIKSENVCLFVKEKVY